MAGYAIAYGRSLRNVIDKNAKVFKIFPGSILHLAIPILYEVLKNIWLIYFIIY